LCGALPVFAEEADLAALDNDAQQDEGLQEAEDQGQDNDDGMEM
jgi:hypothetical protein